jgi:galactitol-specific phosphotransferase system IIC component
MEQGRVSIEVRDGRLFGIVGGEMVQIGYVEPVTINIVGEESVTVGRPVVDVSMVKTVVMQQIVSKMVDGLVDEVQAISHAREHGYHRRERGSVSGKGARRAERWRRW